MGDLFLNSSSTWKTPTDGWVNVAGSWKQILDIFINVNTTWQNVYTSAIPIPEGLIIGFNSTTAPSGWTRFTDADGKCIIGAGSSYAINASAGSETINSVTVSAGAHTGSVSFAINPSGDLYGASVSAGGHTHAYSFNTNPLKRRIVLIKAGAGITALPQNGIVLSATDLAGLSQLYDAEGSIMMASSATGTISAGAATAVVSDTTGLHRHWGANPGGPSVADYENVPEYEYLYAGSHSHTITVSSFVFDLKRTILKAWTNASANFNLAAKLIGMATSTVAPAGWALCDGTNGTPNLKDYFVQFGGSSYGTSTGTNTVGWGVSMAEGGSHNHRGTYHPYSVNMMSGNGVHSDNVTHNHNSTNSTSYIPPYFALAFIMYTG